MLKVLSVLITGFVLLLVLELVRRERLTFKYAFGWIIISSLGVFFAVFDQILFKVAYFCGFELPSNFIFFMMICAFVFLSLLMTIFLCQQNIRNDQMAQKIGILQLQIDQLKESELENPEGEGSDG